MLSSKNSVRDWVQTMAFAHVKEGLRMRLLHAQIVAVMRRLERPPKRRSVRKRIAQIRLEHLRVNGVGVAEQKQPHLLAQRLHQGSPCRRHAGQDATPRGVHFFQGRAFWQRALRWP